MGGSGRGEGWAKRVGSGGNKREEGWGDGRERQRKYIE